MLCTQAPILTNACKHFENSTDPGSVNDKSKVETIDFLTEKTSALLKKCLTCEGNTEPENA